MQPLVFRGALVYHENGLVHVLYKTATPIDDRRTLFCQFVMAHRCGYASNGNSAINKPNM